MYAKDALRKAELNEAGVNLEGTFEQIRQTGNKSKKIKRKLFYIKQEKKYGNENKKTGDCMRNESQEGGGKPACKGNEEGGRHRWYSCNGRAVRHSAAIMCGNEGQSHNLHSNGGKGADRRGTEDTDRSDPMTRERGDIGDLLATGLCILAMTAIMFTYMDNVSLIAQKMEVSQIARKYILRMETVGMLTDEDRAGLCEELAAAGVTGLRLDGTTFAQAGYGQPIILQLQGSLKEDYGFTEKRVSTAKH